VRNDTEVECLDRGECNEQRVSVRNKWDNQLSDPSIF
jgi:hypothetical protein